MKNKSLLISIILMTAILLSACAPGLQTGAANTAATRTLTVTGVGKVSLSPDIAYINIGVHTDRPSATEAVSQNTADTQRLIDALKTAGVDAKDLQTTNFNIWQNSRSEQDGTTTMSYAVDNTVSVTIRKLDKLGDLLDTAVNAGANNINSIQFDVVDKTEALSSARFEAVKAANTQATELASAAGVTLGLIQSIQYYDSTPSPVILGKGMGGGGGIASSVAVPINPGQMDITTSVTIAYEIK